MSSDAENEDLGPAVVKRVLARRFTTDTDGIPPVEEECHVVAERPVSIDIGDQGSFTVLSATPIETCALAAGFLLSDGIINRREDILSIEECEHDGEVIRVKLAESAPGAEGHRRNLVVVSACGMCGSEGVGQMLSTMQPVGNSLRMSRQALRAAAQSLWAHQPLFKESGGTHAAGVFDATGTLLSSAEDIGRHNALDKAIGKRLLAGHATDGCGVALSGRVSLEMVVKSARAGVELIAAVSAPTSLAVDAAARWNITLCAFVRDTRATVFTCPERVLETSIEKENEER